MSEADRMFEELGYVKDETGDKIIYQLNNHEICFYLNRKSFDCGCGIGREFITMQELQAINKKVEELRMEISDEEKKAIESMNKRQNFMKSEPECVTTLEKSIDVLLNLIQKQEKEIEHQKKRNNSFNEELKLQDKVIDKMADWIKENGHLKRGTKTEEIKQYFYRKVEGNE